MATLTVWKFDTADGADRSEEILGSLAKQELITIQDAATVTFRPGTKKPKIRQLHSLTGAGALGGTFWGMLFGLIFFMPFLGAAIGAATGAIAGKFSDVGIDDDFIKRVRDEIQPGTSALFVLSSNAVVDKVRDAFGGNSGAHLMYTNLSEKQESELRESFGEDA